MVQAVARVSLQHVLNVDASVESIHWMSFCITKRLTRGQTTRCQKKGWGRDIHPRLCVWHCAAEGHSPSDEEVRLLKWKLSGTHETLTQVSFENTPVTKHGLDTLADVWWQQFARTLHHIITSTTACPGMPLLPSNIWNLCGNIHRRNLLFMITKQISGSVSWTS